MSELIKSLHNIVLRLPARERKALSPEIRALQLHLKDVTDITSPRRGHHFLLQQVDIVDRNMNSFIGTFSRIDAAKLLKTNTRELGRRLTVGKGEAIYAPRPDNYHQHAVEYLVTRA